MSFIGVFGFVRLFDHGGTSRRSTFYLYFSTFSEYTFERRSWLCFDDVAWDLFFVYEADLIREVKKHDN